MLQDFRLTHVPFLFSGLANLVSGFITLFGAQGVMAEFGFPARVADVPETWPVAAAFNGRSAALGLVQLALYARGQREAADTVMMVMAGYLMLSDTWVLWR